MKQLYDRMTMKLALWLLDERETPDEKILSAELYKSVGLLLDARAERDQSRLELEAELKRLRMAALNYMANSINYAGPAGLQAKIDLARAAKVI